MMKRFLYTLLSLVILFSFCGESFAVDKKTKKEPSKQKVVKKAKPVAKKPPAKNAKAVKPTKGKGKKYDNFIDKNGNGIDDRKEKLVPKAGKQDKKKPTKKKKKQ
jgi:hypothetical protein